MNSLNYLTLGLRNRRGGIEGGGLVIVMSIALYTVIRFLSCRKGSIIRHILGVQRSGGTRFSSKSALKRINVRHLKVYNISLVDIPIH